MKKKLSDGEWKIMEVLWEEAPRTIIQITKALSDSTGWTKHTVMSLLKRIEEKGAVHFEEGEKAKLYYPDVERQDAQLQEAEDFLERVFQGKMGLMLNAMVANKSLTEEEIEQLHQILKGGKTK